MLDCPQCSRPVDGLACIHCGYAEPGAARPVDPLHFRCCNVFLGQQCAELGTLSEGVRGDGPWYCAKHFPPFAGRGYGSPSRSSPPPQRFLELARTLAPPRLDVEAELERAAIRSDA